VTKATGYQLDYSVVFKAFEHFVGVILVYGQNLSSLTNAQDDWFAPKSCRLVMV
jgi:hypothetical protein